MKKIVLLIVAVVSFLFSTSVSAMTAVSPYAAIDSEVFSIQQWVVKEIASLMKLSSIQSMRQSGSMIFKTKISNPEASGSIDLRVEEYSTKYDAKTQNIQMKFRGNLDMAVNTSQSDYDSYDEDTWEYGQIPVKFSATLRYDVTLIVAKDGSMYVTLSSLDGSAQGYEYAKSGFDTVLEMGRAYIGKTYKIPSTYNEVKWLDMATIESTIRSGLLILESRPLFATQSEKNGTYTLAANVAVLDALGLPRTQARINYSNIGDVKIITMANKKNPKRNYMTLVERDGKYIFNLVAKSITNGKKSNMDMSISRDAISMKMIDRETDMLIDWRNNILDMRVSSRGDYSPQYVFAARGPLSLDGSNTNVVVSFAGKDIGSLKSIRSGGTINYSLNMDIDLDMTRLLLDWSGIYSEEKWEYSVTLPTIYELLDKSLITE